MNFTRRTYKLESFINQVDLLTNIITFPMVLKILDARPGFIIKFLKRSLIVNFI